MDLSAISGMQAGSLLFDSSAASMAGALFGDSGADTTTDLSTAAVNLTLGGVAIDINARVLQAQNETLQSVIDMVA